MANLTSCVAEDCEEFIDQFSRLSGWYYGGFATSTFSTYTIEFIPYLSVMLLIESKISTIDSLISYIWKY